MLKTRVITALWLAPLAFLLIFALPTRWFGAVLALLLLVGAWEYQRLAALEGSAGGWALITVQAIIFLGMGRYWDLLLQQAQVVFLAGVGAWLLMLLRLRGFRSGTEPDATYRKLSALSALMSISLAWFSLAWLHSRENGSWWIVALLLIIWAADIGAYFTGRAMGKRKLAIHLSPGKTLEGLAGGLLAAGVIGWVAIAYLPLAQHGHLAWLILAILTALISVGGDLFISLHKRTSGFKDSGHIFPGHGGVLDRLDSLLAGAPLFSLGVIFLSGSGT